jgi:succinate dehydrogenase / fumarate reductase cytochrome b subunit
MENKPLSPHIQIYRWHISSLVSITHRITGIINFFVISLIFLWFAFIFFGESNYQTIQTILETLLGKFVILAITWSFSFQMLSEVRHLIMDLGYGFELQATRISGLLVIFGSIFLTIIIYFIGRGF